MLRKLLFLSIMLAVPTAGVAAELKLLIPMYFYPHMTDGATSDPDWLAVAAAGERVDTVAIINIANGFQDGVSGGDIASYNAAIDLLHASGVKMIGYVSSDYACNDIADIKAAIDTWHAGWEEITGIFVDETQNKLVATDAFAGCPDQVPQGFDYAAFYRELGEYIDGYERFDLSVFNPGTDAPDELVEMAGVTVSFESRGENWATDNTGDSQAARVFDATRFAVLAYDTGSLTSEAITDWLEDADNRNYGYLHLTDDDGWSELPTYMDALVAALECHNGTGDCPTDEIPPEEPSSSGGGGAWLWLSLIALLARRRH